jgi:hypothetical protein
MAHDLLFHTFLLLGILWLSMILLWGWPRRQATTHHDDRQPTEQAVKRSQANKLFPGLTHKPLCTAYEDGAQKHAQGFSLCPAAADRLHAGLPTQGAYRVPFLLPFAL